MKNIKSFFINLICIGIIFLIFWVIKGGSIYERITALQNENNSLKQQIAELQKNVQSGEVAQVSVNSTNLQVAAKQAFDKSEYLEVPVRDLLADSSEYIGKKVKIGPLKVQANHLDTKVLDNFVSTGPKAVDADTDTYINVYYGNVKNFEECKNLSSKFPIIYVSGTCRAYVNDNNNGYIQADEVWVAATSSPY